MPKLSFSKFQNTFKIKQMKNFHYFIDCNSFRLKVHTMPRSNKKKKQSHHPVVPTGDKAVAKLLGRETTSMISRAIVSIPLSNLQGLIEFCTGKCKKAWH